MISRDNAEHYHWGNQCDGWSLVNHPDMLVIHEKMPPGTREIRHYHALARQFFFVLSGVLAMEREGEIHHLQSQQGIEIAAGLRHQAMNLTDNPVEFIVFSHPSPRGDRFED